LGTSATKRLTLGLVLALLGAGVSALLLLQHHGESTAVAAVNQVCGDGTTSGCEAVARSAWSSVRGVPLAAVGLAFYLALAAGFILALVAQPVVREAVAAVAFCLVGAALGIDLVLASVQVVPLKAYCALCISTYVLNAVCLAILWPALRNLGGVTKVFAGGEGRITGVAWLLAVLGLATAVGSLDVALVARAESRSAAMLGTVAPGAEVPRAPTAFAGSEGERWRLEAERLQGILDDPQKLDQYFTEKAAAEYAHAKVETLNLRDTPSRGAAAAPVQVVEFSDFLCPYCRSLAGALHNFLPQSGNRIQIFYKNFPLDQTCSPKLKATTHPGACNLALGAICAADQGQFWAYHDKVFGSQLQDPKPADVARLGREAGLDGTALEACLASPSAKGRLAGQIEEALKVGVQSTPTLFINGKKLPRINDFVQVVDKEAQARGLPPMQAQPAH
jgi:protein-disulfide isomerase/uncharacterized membrane protein